MRARRTCSIGASEKHEDLTGIPEDLVLLHLEDVEPDGLGEWATLTDGDDVSFLRLKGRRTMGCHVGVSFLEAVELLDVVQIVPADDDGALHLGGDNHTLQDFAANADIPVKGHFLSTKFPSLASFGVVKDKPTLRQYLMERLLDFLPSKRFEPMKTASCFW
eukprot:CAMPEP_0177186794 /NCGR_PEP_ID=MMETSP0367-20130122/18844_1 /TAXON_ID=447022 ORGANISM="Scrippsiella hangoei-like, Strain SHHI-4" /NCGR_SAMPLE_ID=MMETSP0367 /ASSEMBLY_ACC=CAM_ASM_000362 /LENGTH=161 /DNA_ID=CAMNT_0018634127 /DNA_START=15 /DNA_END=501 /DNA_ORIENTATION=-